MNKEELVFLIREANETVLEAVPNLGDSFVREQLLLYVLSRLEHSASLETSGKKHTGRCPFAYNFHYASGTLEADCKVRSARCTLATIALDLFPTCDHYKFKIEEDSLKKLDSMWRDWKVKNA